MKNLPPVPKVTDLTKKAELADLMRFLTLVRDHLMSPTTTLGESGRSAEPVDGDMFVDPDTKKVVVRSGGSYVEL